MYVTKFKYFFLFAAVCGYGTYSPTGLVPCLQCPSNTFSTLPPRDGFKECQRCPASTLTFSPGSKLFDECRGKINLPFSFYFSYHHKM